MSNTRRAKEGSFYQGVHPKPNDQGAYYNNRKFDRDRDKGHDDSAHGRLVYHKPVPVPGIFPQPPGYGVRILGKPTFQNPPPHSPVHDPFYRPYGDRIDLDRFPHAGSSKDNIFLPMSEIFENEDDILTHNAGGNEGDPIEVECTKKCDEESEYLCPKACLCINKIHYCDGKFSSI